MNSIATTFIKVGAFLIIAGALLHILPHHRLPGDILVQRKNFTLYFPITTMIVLSIALTIILNFIGRR
jgi:membrane-anchored protein YejM (alkaline phosphatase superfamily)